MTQQSIFTAGNSQVVAIPKKILKKLNLSAGETITIDTDGDRIIISKVHASHDIKPADKDFDAWWNSFISDHAETLDELAGR